MDITKKIRIGELLVQNRIITQEQLISALAEQKKTGCQLGRALINLNFIKEVELLNFLSRQLNIPFLDIAQYPRNPEIIKLLPESAARRFSVLLLENNEFDVLLAMADPTDLIGLDELSRILKKTIRPAVVREGDLLMAIDQSYRRTDEINNLAEQLRSDMSEDDNLDLNAMLASAEAADAPVVKLLRSVFEDAVQVRVSDIHIEPQENKLYIRFRIDGVLHQQTEADLKIAAALVLRLKLMSGLDIGEKRLPQDGRFQIKVRRQSIDVRLSTMPTIYGESVVMRLLMQNAQGFALEKLGMAPEMLVRFRKLLHRPDGIILVTGPTGSGKTTTLYAALSELNSSANKIITVEDPVEYRLPGINQVQVNEKIELDFARVLRSALRQDPDIVLIGEMRDHETAQIGLRAAMTGHLVLSTLHTNDAISSPIRLMDMGVPPYMIAMSLLAVIAQRLVRVVCESCMQPYTPEPFEQAWLKLELNDTLQQHSFVQGKGCSHCNGTGYQGRIGVYELLEMNSELADAANQRDTSVFIRRARQQLAGKTLRSSASAMAAAGRTTVSEAMRITNQFED
ncbi:GspE/PulE family protein [Candidatus Methylobacter oryzae]|uniref:MSHA biogenesis protein MshE n=1 Tax=Candidatus Methylobacter oryzae TaxID=2497749 RepID=A0ABY3C9H1_9GAMM|nr:GspE/PulE family protein [Candidatus Methylobacter oryzae]TRW94321.1 MSHA biogenesis protein MshE [Candidatus Methylobacter oryzae]